MLALFWVTSVWADKPQEVQIADPFVELHTGPGRGYPVFHVVERGGEVTILLRKTSWFKVRAQEGITGWVPRHQMERTLDPSGEQVAFRDSVRRDFLERDWEMGMLLGDFGGATIFTLFANYALTKNFTTEISVSQALSSSANNYLYNINLQHQPFPHWRVSPYLAFGIGGIITEPKRTLVRGEDENDLVSNVGLGLRYYWTDRYLLRLEYNDYVVFSSDDKNENISEYKLGVAIFF